MSEQIIEQPSLPPPSSPPKRRMGLAALALLLAVAAGGFAAWQWIDNRSRFDALQQEVARRLAETEAANRETRLIAGQSRDVVRDAEARLGQLEARMIETQNQRLALESLYKEMSSSRDEWALAEVEQVLLIANQQLQLAGNVKAALIALETADARLARLDRPQLTQLRRAINRDIERLKSAPYVDVTGMAVRLDQVANSVDALALSMDARPPRPETAAAQVPAGFWANIWRETVQDFRDLIRIQNSQKPEAPLVSPGQAFFLRENLKIRLLGARLALLARDEAGFRADMKAASDWLTRYYDTDDKTVAMALAAIRQLAQAEVSIELPDISASLDAARSIRLVRERTLR
ncbi:MAG TPA: uroporphyrinogen-III C-methyltransferase [Burkholderiales bacterium]|jgi:uroporphyrin-3 C-methyltransferase